MIREAKLIVALIVSVLLCGCIRFPTVAALEPKVKSGPLGTVEVEIDTNLPLPSRFFISVCAGPEYCGELCETALVEVTEPRQSYISSLGYSANYRIFVAWLKSANPDHPEWFDQRLTKVKLKRPALLQRAPDGSHQIVAETFFRIGTDDEEQKFFEDRLAKAESQLRRLKKAVAILRSESPDVKSMLTLTDELQAFEIDPFYPQLWTLLQDLAEKAACARDVALAQALDIEVAKSKQKCLKQATRLLEKASSEVDRLHECPGFNRAP